MNQRIKEIIDRCGLYLAPDNPEVFEKELEFFAEEIVRECAKAVNDWYQNYNDIHWDPNEHIKQHFGIEQ